jgi:hypothetical protein
MLIIFEPTRILIGLADLVVKFQNHLRFVFTIKLLCLCLPN